MSNDFRDDGNPFAPPRRSDGADTGTGQTRDNLTDLLPDDSDDYRLAPREDDFDYDPDELLDDEEEPESAGVWNEPVSGTTSVDRREPQLQRWPEDDEEGEASDLFDDEDQDEAEYEASAFDDDNDDFEDADDGGEDFEDDYDEDDDRDQWDDDEPVQRGAGPWPLGLIAAGAVALILLAVGGFGVVQERSAMREQIRDLQARLAVAVEPGQLTQERSTQRELVEENETLSASLESLRLENRQLSDTVAGLEQQLDAQREAAQQASAAAAQSQVKATPRPAPSPAPKPATQPATTATRGDWFVNFGSYREKPLADSWAARLKPAAGKVVVLAAPGGDLYRVRIVSLANKSTAQSVAQSLQKQYDLPELWVGED